MHKIRRNGMTRAEVLVVLAIAAVAMLIIVRMINYFSGPARPRGALSRELSKARSRDGAPGGPAVPTRSIGLPHTFRPRFEVDTSGFTPMVNSVPPWDPADSLETIAESWKQPGLRAIERLERAQKLMGTPADPTSAVSLLVATSTLFSSEGNPRRAYEILEQARSLVEKEDRLTGELLYTIIYLQGVAALRRGENDNCIDCRGESSCILPIAPAAVHSNPTGSRLAIRHFTEYLDQFPDDLEVRWLLNLAHMTLGEHPVKVDARHLISLDRFRHSEFDIGKFRDIGHLAGVNRFNQAGGAIMEDFDNDGLLDLVASSIDPTEPLGVYRNKGQRRLRGPRPGGRSDRPARGLVLRPDRLQQRRLHGHLHPPRRLAPDRDPAQPAPQ